MGFLSRIDLLILYNIGTLGPKGHFAVKAKQEINFFLAAAAAQKG